MTPNLSGRKKLRWSCRIQAGAPPTRCGDAPPRSSNRQRSCRAFLDHCETTNPSVRLPAKPPAAAGLVIVTVYPPTGRAVLGHQNFSWPLFVNTNGVAAVAELPEIVMPEMLPTVILAPRTKLDPKIVIDLLVLPNVTGLLVLVTAG